MHVVNKLGNNPGALKHQGYRGSTLTSIYSIAFVYSVSV